jgi:hypothetical protein
VRTPGAAVLVARDEDHLMNCRHFVPDVIDHARGVVLEPSRQRAVTSHLRSCSSCAALAEQHSAMSLALRRVASEIPDQPPDDLDLRRMLASFDRRRVRPRRISVGVGLSLAASVLIVAGLSIGWKQDAPQPPILPPCSWLFLARVRCRISSAAKSFELKCHRPPGRFKWTS